MTTASLWGPIVSTVDQDLRDALERTMADIEYFLTAAGNTYLGLYVEGSAEIEITDYTQFIRKDYGHYFPRSDTVLPLTLTGVWADDEPFLTQTNVDTLRQDLIAAPGSSLITYTAPVTGAVSRLLQTKLFDKVSVRDFGAHPSLAENGPYFALAFSALNAGLIKHLDLVDGDYVNNTPVAIRRPGSTVTGSGTGTTKLVITNPTLGDYFTISAANPVTTSISDITLDGFTIHATVEVQNGASLIIKNAARVNTGKLFLRNYYQGLRTEGIRDSDLTGIQGITGEHWTAMIPGSCHVYFGMPANPALKSTETNFSHQNFTTAGKGVNQEEDIEYGFVWAGDFDGIWVNESHYFGGKTANWLVDANGTTDMTSLHAADTYIDGYCQINILFQGTGAQVRDFEFDDVKVRNARNFNIRSLSSFNGVDIRFTGGMIGHCRGQGVLIEGGDFDFFGVKTKNINALAVANGYAFNIPSAGAVTRCRIRKCEIDCTNLTYGIFQQKITSCAYYVNHNDFVGDTSTLIAEISYAGSALVGSCFGNTTTRSTAGNFAAAASLALTNIATDCYNITGATTTITTITPTWHGRIITMKTPSAQNFASGGNIRNKANATPRTTAVEDTIMYQYNAITFRWHEI